MYTWSFKMQPKEAQLKEKVNLSLIFLFTFSLIADRPQPSVAQASGMATNSRLTAHQVEWQASGRELDQMRGEEGKVGPVKTPRWLRAKTQHMVAGKKSPLSLSIKSWIFAEHRDDLSPFNSVVKNDSEGLARFLWSERGDSQPFFSLRCRGMRDVGGQLVKPSVGGGY